MAQSLQSFALLLVLAGLSLQFAALWIQTRQFGLHAEQLVLAQRLDALLQGLQPCRRLLQADVAFLDRAAVALLLGAQVLLPLLQSLTFSLRRLEGQHQLLSAAELQLLLELLISPGLGAVLFKPLTCCQQLLLHDAAALLALLHLIEFAPCLFDAGVEQRHAGQFIDQAAAIAVAHRNDAGDISLHHHVAAFRIDAQSAQLGLQLLEIARNPIRAVTAAVRPSRHHPQLACDGPFLLIRANPWPLLRRLQPVLSGVRLPFGQVETNADRGFG